ncbi:glutathione S-transferase family protein [Luteimonas huabeiensis]|uniref:glutathione S-transferase family protein n=1 Tax=Luteimonas huabeiensis TaxID=1244513 RepID=UPI000463B584|nr:glutathione S-transferase [Luteimonas huabeiensis]
MIVVHHLEKSRAHRIVWLLEELGLDYDVVRYRRDPDTLLAPPELRAVHPLGRSPVVVDGGDTLAESGAIVETLLERYDPQSRLAPAVGTPERVRWHYWMHFAEGSAMPPLLISLILKRVREARMPFFARPVARTIADRVTASLVAPQLRANGQYMDQALAADPWFAGASFSAADVQMSFAVQALAARGGIDDWPHLQDWLRRAQAREAWRRTLARVGPLELAG